MYKKETSFVFRNANDWKVSYLKDFQTESEFNSWMNERLSEGLVHYTNKRTNEESVNVTISLNDTPDQYGNNASIWVSQTKEERDAKAPKVYIGNGKVIYDSDMPRQNAPEVPTDLPF